MSNEKTYDRSLWEALENLHILTCGLADTCICCPLFGSRTQEAIDICDGRKFSPHRTKAELTREFGHFKVLRQILQDTMPKKVDFDDHEYWQTHQIRLAFLTSFNREIRIAESHFHPLD